MKSKEKKYFNITLNEDSVVTFDTNIEQPDTLLKVIATANATIVDALTAATGRDDIIDILVEETSALLNQIKEDGLSKTKENEGGETDESN